MATSVPDFRLLFERAPAPYLILDPDLRIVAVSDAYLAATMTERERIVGRPIFDVFPDNPEESGATGENNLRSSLHRVIRQLLPDTMAVQKYDIRKPEADGGGFEERHWSPINTPIVVDGALRYIVHRVEDVTDFVVSSRERTAEQESTQELRVRATQLERELYQRAQDLQRANQELREVHAELEGRVAKTSGELAREADARQRTESELRRSEDQLRQAQKLEAVGRLAAGIAHDFNNLLSVVLSYSEELLVDLPDASPSRRDALEIQRAGERAAELTRQLLVFSRQQVLAPKILDLNDVLSNLGRMLGRMLGEDIELALLAAPLLGQVKADPGQIEQVVMNLVVNARDAMPGGGKLTIATSNVDLDDAYARDHLGVEPGRYVMLSVSDTGVGMDKATQARLFEPFFTTKGPGRGTGLGLSTVFGIVKQSHGSIWVYSEPGQGTTFKIYLPRVDAAADRPLVVTTPAGGSETILLVEDEPQVRAVVRRTLERAGYAVVVAQDPHEAVRIAEAAGPIDLLLTDVVMPYMNGRELAERVRSRRPGVRVLFTSGYTDDAILRHGVLDEGVPFLQKPITPASLMRSVRETLDA
jgi:signal transduction histidine kinase